MFKKIRIVIILILMAPVNIKAQNDTINYEVGMLGVASNGIYSPFWIQSNQFGKISSNPTSANVWVGLTKDFGNKNRLFDYGFKANLLLQTDRSKTTAYFHEI